MLIETGTNMILFRYNNYKSFSFITEHQSVLKQNGYVWMLKIGKKSSEDKIKKVQAAGGWIILRAPKSDGGISYISHFTVCCAEQPSDHCYPQYYEDLIKSRNEAFDFFEDPSFTWFRIDSITDFAVENSKKLVMAVNGKSVDKVIETTRTAFMFIKNNSPIMI